MKKKLFNKIFEEKSVAVCMVVLLALSLIMPIYVGLFNYASGDDLLYGAILRNGLRHGEPIGVLAKRVLDDVVSEYNSFQGTWASQILWRLEPSIFGEKAYVITIFLSLGILITGIGYLINVVVVRFLGYSKWIGVLTASLMLLFNIQFMPFFRGGLYWYTGMVQYTFAYGVSMFSIGWSILYILTAKKRYLIGDMLTLAYLGGAGFPAIVQGGMIIFFITVWSFLAGDGKEKKRSLMLIIPLTLLAIGFGLSALAPGNSVRGGEDYGLSVGRIIDVFVYSFRDGIRYSFDYIKSIRPLFLLPLLLFAFSFSAQGAKRIKIRDAIVSILLGFSVVCMVHSPEIFAGSTVAAGFSGGVYDIYFYVFVMWFAFLGLIIGNVVRSWGQSTKKMNNQTKINNMAQHFRKYVVIFTVAFVVVFWRFLIGNSLDYLCYNYISSGALSDFEQQMQERLLILEDDTIKDAVVPEMNDQQGPLMHMPLTSDSSQYTNYATGLFYEKESVVAVSREEWNQSH
ncbi:hypothetical protein [Butyrivibrio proteoclasticus]|uniref:hypothetical protein n=1 Tax=Butyrivibrio proteoclasticus TaxID=43305 RepID=UPI00047D5211|nr:hypothetical protein [Butyrivibrio proteoclasticus]